MLSLVSQTRHAAKTLINFSVIAKRTAKFEICVKWERPERPASWGPIRSGDMGTFTEPDPESLCVKYQIADELNDAEPNVRNQFTLGWHNRAETRLFYMQELENSVKCHQYDDSSDAVQIARHTGAIRFMQYAIEQNLVHGWLRRRHKYDIRSRMIERMELLTELRRVDYRQYEWILERMDLQYKPKPHKENEIMIARKEGLRQLTDAYCADLKAKKLDDYRKELHAQKLPYLEQKIKNLQYIRSEQRLLALPVTITTQQIDEVQKQLDALVAERALQPAPITSKKWKAI